MDECKNTCNSATPDNTNVSDEGTVKRLFIWLVFGWAVMPVLAWLGYFLATWLNSIRAE